mgnify:CR=1 FL=1
MSKNISPLLVSGNTKKNACIILFNLYLPYLHKVLPFTKRIIIKFVSSFQDVSTLKKLVLHNPVSGSYLFA